MSAALSKARPLRSTAVQGYGHFTTPLRRLIVDYDAESPAQAGVRAFLRKPLLDMAASHPDVEVVVRRLPRGKAAVLRGHYVNGRDKVVCVNNLEANGVASKVKLLLEASGAKLRPLKNDTLEAGPGNESARGVWSALHGRDGGYTI